MSLKLGELLISEGIITQDQLDEALKCHVIFGVKLGSSLIELGFVKEDVLLNLLSRKLGVPPVTFDELFHAPPDVIARISPAVAEKFRVIPIRLDNKRLHVAMTDPTDLMAQEELAFITGNIIVPAIAPDIQILYALEKYYGVKFDHRYVSANYGIQRMRLQSTVDESDGFITDDSKYTISADYSSPAGEATPQPAPPTPAASAPSPIPAPTSAPAQTGGLLNVTVPKNIRNEQPSPEADAPTSLGLERYTVDKLSLDFSKTATRDEVADVFIRYLGQEFTCCALMTLRGTIAFGWRAAVGGLPVKGFEDVNLDLSKSSELSEIYTGKHYYLGPLAESSAAAPLIQALGLAANPILALPVVMNERIVALIAVSAEPSSLLRLLEELQKLVYKASLTFQILVLKNKLLQT